jgi:Mor family transcriptional regulator
VNVSSFSKDGIRSTRDEREARDSDIVSSIDLGVRPGAIAKKHHLSLERIRQIVKAAKARAEEAT